MPERLTPTDLSTQSDVVSRELFIDRLEMALLRSFRYVDRRFAVLSLSIEQYSGIETSFGYDTADHVAREFGHRLKAAVRNYDSIGHIAGDQYAVLLESVHDVSDPARVAMRVHDSLRTRLSTRFGDFMVSTNIGIVMNHSGADSAGRLMQLAGLARLRAATNSSAYELYDPAMQEHARLRLQREMELRRAIEEQQFELHYQPIISLQTGRITQTEALVRWRHPQRGLVPAAEFIGLAEETGLAVPMGWFTLTTACRQLTQWRSQRPTNGGIGMSVNMTAGHFKQRDLADRISATLKGAGVSSGISLEVTERLLIHEPAKAVDTINALKQQGVAIHLDDFGTGYSSLQYLHELPFDAIKIDKGFVARMGKGGRDAQIIVTIRELARQLGVPVVAEGVETEDNLRMVRELGCEYAQGYFFARPMQATAVAELIESGPAW